MAPLLRVTATPLFAAPISPLIYGEFVEFINDLIPGMWAERLRDRAFAGETVPRHVYRHALGAGSSSWRAFQASNGPYGHAPAVELAFDLDPESPFVGARSARICVRGTPPFLAGIVQDRVGVRQGERLDLELYLRASGLEGRVRVFVGREYGAYVESYDELVFEDVGPRWQRFAGALHSPVTDAEACFAIALEAPGALWVDKVSLLPADHCEGWRADVVEAVRASRPGIVRFGGSSLIYYDWRQGLGSRAQRVPFVNEPWHNTEEHDVGLDEFLRFCALVQAEALLCVNANSSTPEEIAAQIQYTNGPADSEYGRLRAANGHPAPYGVRYWQIGNEQRGSEYEDALPAYIRAMKQADPPIALMASYPSERVIGSLGRELDFVCPHFYGADLAAHQRQTDELRRLIATHAANPGLKLGITEWNHTGGDWGDGRAWLQTLYNGLHVAGMLNQFQRNGDLIRIANRSNLVNSSYSGSIQARPLDLYVTPAYHVQRLYSRLSGSVAVTIEADEGELDLSATRDADGARYVLWVVNPHAGAARRSVSLAAGGISGPVRVVTLGGTSPAAVNSLARQDHVAPVEQLVEAGELSDWDFPAYSLTGLEMHWDPRS